MIPKKNFCISFYIWISNKLFHVMKGQLSRNIVISQVNTPSRLLTRIFHCYFLHVLNAWCYRLVRQYEFLPDPLLQINALISKLLPNRIKKMHQWMNGLYSTPVINISMFLQHKLNSPSLRGFHVLTVRPRSTSTTILLPSIFFPSACLYAAATNKQKMDMLPHQACKTFVKSYFAWQ